jgi:hypothetical protein
MRLGTTAYGGMFGEKRGRVGATGRRKSMMSLFCADEVCEGGEVLVT